MKSKKIWLILLLIAMNYSIVHDYTFLLHDDEHSVQEYVTELEMSASDTDFDFHDVHYKYHITLLLAESFFFPNIPKKQSIFTCEKPTLSWNDFNFFKPPIV